LTIVTAAHQKAQNKIQLDIKLLTGEMIKVT